MAHDVFVSYATEDHHSVTSLVHLLEADGVRCWYAPRDVLPGANYGAQIADAIRNTHILILVLSSHANESTPVSNEVERAVHNGVVVIPIRIEDVQPSPNLELHIAGAHWLDALSEPLESHQASLVRAVRKHLEAIGAEPARPPVSSRPHPQPEHTTTQATPGQQSKQQPRTRTPNRTPLIAAIVCLAIIGASAAIWSFIPSSPQANAPAPKKTSNAQEDSKTAATTPTSEQDDPIDDRTAGPETSAPSETRAQTHSTPPDPNSPDAPQEFTDSHRSLVAGQRATGTLGSNSPDAEHEWIYTPPAHGYVQLAFENRNQRGADQGTLDLIEVSSNGESVWKRTTVLKPGTDDASRRFVVRAHDVVRVRIQTQDSPAVMYSIEPTFTPLGVPCPAEDSESLLETGITSIGSLGFERGDTDDDWTLTAPANGYIQLTVENRNQHATEQGMIDLIAVTLDGEEVWNRTTILKPDTEVKSDKFAVREGQAVRTRVKIQDAHAATYSLLPAFTPLEIACPADDEQSDLELGVAAIGCLGFEAWDVDDQWTYIAPANGYVQIQIENKNERGTEQGMLDLIEVSSNGDSIWKRTTILNPGTRDSSDTFAVRAGQTVQVRIKIQDRHAAIYSVEPTFAQLSIPCPPDDSPSTLEPGATSIGCVGFDTGDIEDEWTFTAPANGTVQINFENKNIRGTQEGSIDRIEVSLDGQERWDRSTGLKPGYDADSARFAVRAGQVIRVRLKVQDGHAALYAIRLELNQ